MKKVMMIKQTLLSLFTIAILTFAGQNSYSQGVTTASIQGSVKDDVGITLPGATIVAIHQPSGTKYGAVSNNEGRFTLPNLRVGGPYLVTVSYVGYDGLSYDGISLGLGQSYSINAKLTDGIELATVEVTAQSGGVINSDRTGASLNLNADKINSLPTISRSINDFTRLTPQSNGTSFAGTSNRFNNYTIDGNIYNNNFGLGSGQFAGSSPISLDVIEEVQVNLAPYDVRQGGFTGANVNAITKSGTNKFTATVYSYLRNDQMIGDRVGDTRLTLGDSKSTIRGVSVGGPIIKNKLFFFANYEKEEESIPSFQKVASRPGLEPNGLNVSRVPADRLDFVRNQIGSLYGYETGPYENYQFGSEQERLNLRLDWNINQNHKFSVRYNRYGAFTDVPTNGNSIRYISTRYRNTTRTGIEAMNFRNNNYTQDRAVQSFVAELNSKLGNNVSNQLNVGWSSITDPNRGVPGEQNFPFIEVLEPDASGNPLYYFSLGNELFTVGNLLNNRIFNATNNLSIYKGKHTITLGANFEYMTFNNAFNPVFNGFYRFNSYDNFVESVINKNPNVHPDAFAKGFALDGSTTPPTDETRFGQLGLYVQDEFQVTQNLKLTGGLRVDLPFYPITIPTNGLLDDKNKQFSDPNGNQFTPDVSTFPTVNPLFSPRVGFNWDVNGDKVTQVRGGTGVFSGRIPFVWLSNQVNGSGVIRGGYGLEGQEVVNSGILFNPDVTAHTPANPSQTLSNELNLTDRNFRLPQVWRTNIGVDRKLPFGIIGTMDFIYSQDVSTPIAYNPVLREPDGVLNGPDARGYWTPQTGFAGYSNDRDFRNVFYLTNARERADYASITFQLQKEFTNGFYTMVAYTRSRARDLDAAGGSQAISLWPATVQNDRNNPELGFAGFDQPNRLISNISYRTKNTTLSMFYDGGEFGRFSHTYSGNFGDASNRLIYVPNTASELNFQQFSLGGKTITPEMQQTLFDDYINQDKYLSSRRGQYAERNGGLRPWVHRFDFRVTEDIILSKNTKNKLQLSMDILNIGNLLNSAWGIPQIEWQRTPLNYRGRNDNNEPIYRLNANRGTTEFPTETFRESVSLANTWRMQVGVRYLFN